MDILELLFPLPREVGNPSRCGVIFTRKQLADFIAANSGINDCFITVYRYNTFISEIDKLFFDFDGEGSLHFFTYFYTTLTQKFRFKVIPVITGKKGFAAYVMLAKTVINSHDAKFFTHNAAKYLLMLCFGSKIPKCVDTHVIGDTRRLCRITGTLRKDQKNFCTVLPANFFCYSDENIYLASKNSIEWNPILYEGDTPSILDFPLIEQEITVESKNIKPTDAPAELTECQQFLKNILRPCLFYELLQPEPNHLARVAATIDLLKFYSKTFIAQLYAGLNWVDYSEAYTLYQIDKCTSYSPFSCRKIRSMGIPTKCPC